MSTLPPIPQIQQQTPDVTPPDVQGLSAQQPLDPAVAQQLINSPQLQNILQSGMPSASGVFNQQSDQQRQQIGQQQQQGDRVKQMLSNYLDVLSRNVTELNRPQGAGERFRTGFGEGMMHNAGVMTPTQRRQLAVENSGNAVKSILEMQQGDRQQQQLDLQRSSVTIMTQNGPMQVPMALAKTLAPAYLRSDTSQANNERNNATKRLGLGYNEDGTVKPLTSLSIPQQLKAQASDALNRLNKAKTDALNADPNTGAGQLALSKLQISEQMARANITKAAAASGMENIAAQKFAKDYIDGMQDDEGNPIGVQQYKAITAGDKAPAAMLQQAEYAKGGLEQFKDARSAIQQLRAHGVLTGVPANKMEEMLFGNGLIDPTLSQEDQKLVGQARAGLGLGATAALRAHTGRGSREIYQDFVKRFGIGQGNQALDASLDQGEKLLTGYANAGSNSAIHALRHPAGSASSSGVVTLTDGGKSYKIPAALKANFLKDHPNAR